MEKIMFNGACVMTLARHGVFIKANAALGGGVEL
jgi:hypothetical protein